MKLEDLEIYNLAMNIGENVWNIVDTWNYFSKDTIGKQWTRAADSIAANISEGFGRYSYKDARKFYYIARGSLYESKTWLDKSNNRKLIPIETHTTMVTDLNNLGVKLNNFKITQQTNNPRTINVNRISKNINCISIEYQSYIK